MKRIGLLVFLCAFFLIGCKQTEKIVIEKKVKRMGVGKIIKQVNDHELKFNTLSVNRLTLSLDKDGKSNSVRGLYKIRQDSVIQVSIQKLSIPVGKFEAIPDSFRIVYFLEKKLFSGGYNYVSDLLGTEVDFYTIQAILSNQLYSFRQDPNDKDFKDFSSTVEDNLYKISSIRERKFRKFDKNEEKLERYRNKMETEHLIKQDIYIDPDLFVVRKMVFNDIDYDRILNIEFSEFQVIKNQWFPGNIKISFIGKEKIHLNIGLSKVEIDEAINFNFSVPSKYSNEKLN
jgi:hypothetical protein